MKTFKVIGRPKIEATAKSPYAAALKASRKTVKNTPSEARKIGISLKGRTDTDSRFYKVDERFSANSKRVIVDSIKFVGVRAPHSPRGAPLSPKGVKRVNPQKERADKALADKALADKALADKALAARIFESERAKAKKQTLCRREASKTLREAGEFDEVYQRRLVRLNALTRKGPILTKSKAKSATKLRKGTAEARKYRDEECDKFIGMKRDVECSKPIRTSPKINREKLSPCRERLALAAARVPIREPKSPNEKAERDSRKLALIAAWVKK